MDENRVERLKKILKKQAALLDELQLNLDAELFRVTNAGAGMECATEMSNAKRYMVRAVYHLLQTIACADGEALTDQMMLDLRRLQGTPDEEGENE